VWNLLKRGVNRPSGQTSVPRRFSRNARPALEALEDRLAMTAWLSSGALMISGGSTEDTYTIRTADNQFVIREQLGPYATGPLARLAEYRFNLADVTSITMFTNSGGDTINLQSIGAGVDVRIDPGSDNDFINLPSLGFLPTDASVAIAGSDGYDTVTVAARYTWDVSYEIQANSIRSWGPWSFGQSYHGKINYDVENVVVNTGQECHVSVKGTSSRLELNTLGQNSVSILENTYQSSWKAAPLIYVNGRNNADTLFVSLAGTVTNPRYQLAEGHIGRVGATQVYYGNMQKVTLRTTATAEWFTVYDPIATPTTIDGGGAATDPYDTLEVTALTHNTWDITGVNAGALNTAVQFRNVEQVIGGVGRDHFFFAPGSRLGFVLGGTGMDTLDYSKYSSAVSVNLASGVSAGLIGLGNIENVVGSALDDTITGNQAANVLQGGPGRDRIYGGAGRDLLIGGLGADYLDGQDGEDILIGGTTTYDANDVALYYLMREWTSGSDYATRVANLKVYPGSFWADNAGYTLAYGTSVLGDNVRDTLVGGTALDWFWADLGTPLYFPDGAVAYLSSDLTPDRLSSETMR